MQRIPLRPEAVLNESFAPIRSVVKELADAGITRLNNADADICKTSMPAHNNEFAIAPEDAGSMFVAWVGDPVEDILCGQYEQTGGK